MKKSFTFFFIFIINLALLLAAEPNNDDNLFQKDKSSAAKGSSKRIFIGGDIGATFGDYTQISINPLIGYQISPQVATGLQFIYNHSWQYVNQGMTNQTTIQSNTYGGNLFVQYNPIINFFLKGEFEYDSYSNYQTTQGTNVSQAVPFIYLGMGYSKQISKSATLNAGIKVDVLNNINSPYEDFTPFFYVGAGVGI